MKTCCHCKIIKPVTDYGRDRHNKDGLKYRCRSCDSVYAASRYPKYKERSNAYSLEWSRKNKKHLVEYGIEYSKKNREKMRAKGRSWYLKNRDKAIERMKRAYRSRRSYPPGELLAKQNGQCFYCGNFIKKATIDHVVPVSKGGLDTKGNLVASCKSCNIRKADKLVIHFKKHSKICDYILRI